MFCILAKGKISSGIVITLGPMSYYRDDIHETDGLARLSRAFITDHLRVSKRISFSQA